MNINRNDWIIQRTNIDIPYRCRHSTRWSHGWKLGKPWKLPIIGKPFGPGGYGNDLRFEPHRLVQALNRRKRTRRQAKIFWIFRYVIRVIFVKREFSNESATENQHYIYSPVIPRSSATLRNLPRRRIRYPTREFFWKLHARQKLCYPILLEDKVNPPFKCICSPLCLGTRPEVIAHQQSTTIWSVPGTNRKPYTFKRLLVGVMNLITAVPFLVEEGLPDTIWYK